MKDSNDEVELEYYCDNARHLICTPYTVANLHLMAKDLGLKPNWFHRKKKFHHYDIPVRMQKEIISKCHLVLSTDLIRIIKGEPIKTQIN